MTSSELARDEAARRTVVDDLDRTLFLEAGAGSGKTRCLINRFVALVESGVPADHIAAITFTEKAAGELVDRIRGELERGAREGTPSCVDALAVLDRAAIGTLHSFAQRILTEHPIEAGLPPRITVMDEIASQVAFEERWEAYVDRLLDDPTMEQPLRLLLASDDKLRHLHDVAVAFDANWDLVADRADQQPPAVPPLDVSGLLASLDEVIALADHCTSSSDKLLEHLQGTVQRFALQLRDAVDDDSRLGLLTDIKLGGRKGRATNWTSIGVGAVRARLDNLQTECDALRRDIQEAVLQVLASSLAKFTVGGAEARRQAGELEFHDLLVLARAMLRNPQTGPEVRAALAARYPRLLLDEFQDTDPIQIELAVLIASDDPAAGQKDWWGVDVEPGRLFIVGDPKQSIYRFRRADIAMFLKARNELVGSTEQLTQNFRTGKPIVEWVNATFATLITEVEDSQPAYLPLLPVRDGPEVGPPVAFIGTEHDGKRKAAELREAEAADVAGAIHRAMRERWLVADEGPDHTEVWRPTRWSDFAVLLPARTSLPFLERALETADIPYRAETSSLVYGTREVRELMLVARAVDDPTDSLSVVAALRTPGFGCGDDDLFTWRQRYGGRWDHQAPCPAGAPADHPVALGIAWLGELHRERMWLSPSQVLERILRDRRFFELGAAERRPRDLWRRLRFVLDQCRAWEEAGGVTLRQYLHWVEGQSAEGSRVIETVLPETDDDAVRILTIHGAKGLQFPIVVLSGLTTKMKASPRGVQVRFPPTQGWAIKLCKGMSTTDFDATQPLDEQMDYHERLRLLYVATTRARDHLVLSVHRKSGNHTATSAEVLHEAGWDPMRVELLDVADEPPLPPAVAGVAQSADDLPTVQEWHRVHDAALAEARRPVAISATRLAAEEAARREAEEEARRAARGDPGLAKGPRDIDLPPWQKGRYGTAIGRAVHGVLQTVDLATGDSLVDACAAQAAAEGVLGRESVIEALCRSALGSDVIQRAARSKYWREVYVGVPYGDAVLEGFIDLLYEDDDGLVIVDYKTDSWRSAGDLDVTVERYRVQLQAYAGSVRDAVGRDVARALLLFLSHDESVVRAVEPYV
ncbi:UvrD-helicase domain-containing protein [Mycolicibacterium austroafricanum]|uniref:UvrD-helicase domain-containing protein n=1 Tax=Mycolicibacterium austroafricanum TaxID=39687 RepID=UPI001CA35CBA|nr:UvrD-helicase domain-containing protein [Mycolicibacterium austroafricanum]QZT60294.1 UvrD-helicase domain-containing protein [Mycolicibacterium austroafricanum]